MPPGDGARLNVPDELLAACRAGSRDALGELFDRCKDRVYSTALHVCGDRAAAADIAQEVFLKVFVHLPRFESRSAFTTWLYRVTVNAAIDHRRASRPVVPLEDVMPEPSTSDVDPYVRMQRRRRITAALVALPDALRVPVVLRHVQGLSYQEIAGVLQVSIGTVASRLSRAHARLASELRDLAPEGS